MQIPPDEIAAAHRRIAGWAMRTPIVRLDVDAPAEIYLKLENLQPIRSFKVRGAANAMLQRKAEAAGGVWTASAGNMAQGVAWCARRLGVRCAVVVPETIPGTKLRAIERLGARAVHVSVEEWLDIFELHRHDAMDGLFVHPFSDAAVMAGNGTIGLEIVEDHPDVDSCVVPYGGGGLACGIAFALRTLRPTVEVYAAEVETAAPLAASLGAGRPMEVPHTPSFVDGIGAPRVFPEMFELASALLDGSLVVGLDETATAIRLLAERNAVVAEGAGASSVAAALSGRAGSGKVVCVVSGGNIDASTLKTILEGDTP
jgi:threonine dehydratase